MALVLKAQKSFMTAVVRAVAKRMIDSKQSEIVIPDVQIAADIKVIKASLQAAVKRYNDNEAPVTDAPELAVVLMADGDKYLLEISKVEDFEAAIQEALDSAIFLDHGEKYEPDVHWSDDEVAALVQKLMDTFMTLEQRGVPVLLSDYHVDLTALVPDRVSADSLLQLVQTFEREYREYYEMLNGTDIGEITPLYLVEQDGSKYVELIVESKRDDYLRTKKVSAFVGTD